MKTPWNMGKRFSIRERLISFSFAFKGLQWLIRHEHNAWLHIFFALLAITLGFIFSISLPEWIVIVFCIGLVFAAEAMNSAVERMVDLVTPDYNDKAGIIKDLAAAAVLITALMSLVAGSIIFTPHIITGLF